jgi:hypothetical protein
MSIPSTILRRVIGISLTFGIMFSIYALGIKGVMGFLLGMIVMSSLIFSQNPMVLWLVEQTKSQVYVEEIKKR